MPDARSAGVHVAAKPRSRRSRFHFGCVGLIALMAAMVGAAWAFDAFVTAPWAHAIGSRQTLTGAWSASFPGASRPAVGAGMLYIEIERGSPALTKPRGFFQARSRYQPYAYFRGRPLLFGTALWCRADGSSEYYTFRGSANRSASDLRITFAARLTPTSPGPRFNETHGGWDGASALTLTGPMRIYEFGLRHEIVFSASRDSVTLAFHPVIRMPASCASR